MVWPTVYSLALEHKNIANPAISSMPPTLPLGFPSPTVVQSTSVSPPNPTPVLSIQVGNGPGAIAFTIIFSLIKVAANILVK